MELDELKNRWKQLDNHVKSQDEKIRQLTDQVIASKVKSPLNTLRQHCIIAAVVVPFLLPFFFWAYDYVGLTCPEWQKTILYALTILFIGFTLVRELYFIYDLSKIDICKDSAIESLQRTIKFRRHYKWGVLIDLIIGIAFITVAFSALNKEFMYGVFIGGIVGGFIGTKLYRFYNRTINDLESALVEWNSEK